MKNLADPDKIAWAAHLREQGATIAQIVEKTGVARTSLYRHMPPRPAEPLTADGVTSAVDPQSGPALRQGVFERSTAGSRSPAPHPAP